MKAKEYINPRWFIIQWHLTERCNWNCEHCYQETRDFGELTFREVEFVLKQCLDLFRAFRISKDRAFINIGGGEPLLREDFPKILALFKKYRNSIRFQIMTNGSLVTGSVANNLRESGVTGVQVSLEGLEKTNDRVRGEGNFKKTIEAIKILTRKDIKVRTSLTLTKINLAEVKDFAVYLKSIGVSSLGMRRYVPMGRGEKLNKLMPSPLELRNFYLKREELKRNLDTENFKIPYGCEDAIFLGQYSFQNYYLCAVTGGHHLSIFTNGDVLACRRFPVLLGNVLRSSLLDIYFSSDKLWGFRNPDNAHPLCRECPYFKYCLGGAKCVTHAYFKNSFAPDPQCWRLFKRLPAVGEYKRSE